MQNGILKFREFLSSLESIHEHQRLTPPLQFPGALATLTLCFTIPRKGLPRWLSGKDLPANAADVGLIPGLEDPLEKGTTTCSSILAWEIPWTEEPRGPTVHGVTKSQTQLSYQTTIYLEIAFSISLTSLIILFFFSR